MKDTRPEQLSEKQKDVLRLVARGFRTYEVATELGISEVAVTERLREARRTMGVSSSIAAARLLAHAERTVTEYPGDRISVIVPAAAIPDLDDEAGESGLRDNQSPYRAFEEAPARNAFPWPVEQADRRSNALTWYQILAWGLFIAFIAVSLLGAVKALQIHS